MFVPQYKTHKIHADLQYTRRVATSPSTLSLDVALGVCLFVHLETRDELAVLFLRKCLRQSISHHVFRGWHTQAQRLAFQFFALEVILEIDVLDSCMVDGVLC